MSQRRLGRGSIHVLHPSGGSSEGDIPCDQCGTSFALKYAYQQIAVRDRSWRVCSQQCREAVIAGVRPRDGGAQREPFRLAVINQKGGTGKTTTAVNLAAGLAEAGRRVLLVDCDPQGHVAVSLGVRGARGLYHLLVENADPRSCIVEVDDHLHLMTSNETLASAEILLARMNEGRDRILRTRMASVTEYDFVLMDCGPSLSLLNTNALTWADEVLVPVSCDFLSLVGVRQILKTLKNVNELLLHPVRVFDMLPTFHDQRNRISNESIRSLKSHFHDRVLPPVRVNTRLKEAPSHHKTIFEYAPRSRGADDYRRLVRQVLRRTSDRTGASDESQAAGR